MNRRAVGRVGLSFAALLALAGPHGAVLADRPEPIRAINSAVGGYSPNATSTAPAPPPTPADDFLPERRDLSECIGVLERPGCGSTGRGGWRQTLVFALMAGGLGLVTWRIVAAARAGRRVPDDAPNGMPDG